MPENEKNNETLPTATDLVGQTIGDYVVLRRLGSGGMANVYLAEQTSLKRKVALKVMRDDLVGDPTYVSRFVREAQSAASLVQANIVQIYEVGHQGQLHFIAQEYVAGRNLRQHLARHGALEPIMAFNVLRQVGMALQKAAESGLIHRDIKPENIMITPNGEIKVTDFGLARFQSKNQKSDLTQIGIAMGTPLYMSPEQIEGRDVDHRSDLYSLGVTAYHMLAGKPPFEGDTPLAVALQHLNKQAEDMALIRPDVSSELCQVVHKLMAKKPEDRFQSASDFLRELRKIRIDDHEDWESLAQKLAESPVTVASLPAEGRLEVTRQLQAVIKGNQPSYWLSYKFLLPISLLALFSIVSGVALAFVQPIPEFVSPQQQTLRKQTVKEQFQVARWSGKPEDYRAVIEFFPPLGSNDYETLQYHNYAMKNLGIILLKEKGEKDLLEALKYFRVLSENEIHPPSQATGWAGLACVYDEMQVTIQGASGNEFDQFTGLIREQLEKLEENSPWNNPYFDLLDKYLQERVLHLIEKYNPSFHGSANTRFNRAISKIS
jgi:eukaryotic-like serine/threonine-protein kinase